MITIPSSEYDVSFVRASGKGGQNINKVATKVVLRWSINRSHSISGGQKAHLRQKLAARLVGRDELIVSADSTRSQAQNRRLAESRLRQIVHRALIIPKKRRLTTPTKASKQKRLTFKKHHSIIKQQRRGHMD